MADGTGTAVVVHEERSGGGLALTGSVRIGGMADVFALSKALARARGFVPKALVDNPDAIAAVILTGVELGIGPMEAMRGIHIVEGKPTMSAEMMLARARKAGVRTRWLETNDKTARLAVTVPGDTEPQTMEFSWADAQRVGCTGKENWKRYPAAMLRARCISAAMRAFCPEVLGSGVYESTSGELTEGEPTTASTVPAVLVEAVQEDPAARVAQEVAAIERELAQASSDGDVDMLKGRFALVRKRCTDAQIERLQNAARAARNRIADARADADERRAIEERAEERRAIEEAERAEAGAL